MQPETKKDFFATRNPPDEFYSHWDSDTGKIGMGRFGSLIQDITIYCKKIKSVADVVALLDASECSAQDVIDAVEEHPWMYLEGPTDDYSKLMIQHDGE